MANLIMVLLSLCLFVQTFVLIKTDESGYNLTDNAIVSDQQTSPPPVTTEVIETAKDTKETDQATAPEGNLDFLMDRSAHLNHLVYDDRHHHHHGPVAQGFWKKKFIWRPRWVKTWQEKKVYVAVWKRMWGPAMLNEWVPIPKPPPGWFKPVRGSFAVKSHPY